MLYQGPFTYVSVGQAFVGCPLDAERYERRLQRIWRDLPVPGVKRNIMHWKRDFDAFASTSAQPSQYQIARTSDPATDPVFILFAHMIGTPVRPPSRDSEDWRALRTWFDQNGWPFVAMLGDPDFKQSDHVPEGKIPLSGTMYELFDAMRSGGEKNLTIYDLSQVAWQLDSDRLASKQQAIWCERLLAELRKSYPLLTPQSDREFMQMAERDLRRAFEVPLLDPLTDPLPGLEAVSSRMPLLFGRGEQIERLSEPVFQDQEPSFTAIVGVSGAGKSSLVRGGLMREWFMLSPPGIARRAGATALLIEPDSLSLDSEVDPLDTLANLLASDSETVPDRVVGPLPGPLVENPPRITPANGNLSSDLQQALDWWETLIDGKTGPLVLILDQAEQIEAEARRTAQAESDRTGLPVAPKLSPQWQRFIALAAALSGTLDPSCLTPALAARIDTINGRLPLKLILTLHRERALDLWPLAPVDALPRPIEILPLTTPMEWHDIIEGTCRSYGFTLDGGLRDAMVNEAVGLAKRFVSISEPEGGEMPTTHSEASVLPLVKTALQRILTLWRDRHIDQRGHHRPETADRHLRSDIFAPVADIARSIDELGETAWTHWQEKLAQSTKINLRSIFGQREFEEEQTRRFADLMSGLVDARDAEKQDLSKLKREGNKARRHEQLIAALHEKRLLMRTGEQRDRLYYVLSHRSALDRWQRARDWLARIMPSLAVKARLSGHFKHGDSPLRWHEDHLDDFADLALNWIGSGEEEDRLKQDYLKSGLVARIDPTQVQILSERKLARLPFAVLRTGDTWFFNRLLEKCMVCPDWPRLAPGFAIAISQVGDIAALNAVLDQTAGSQQTVPVDTVHAETGLFPLLMVAQDGHEEVVRLLLDKGADIAQRHPSNGATSLAVAIVAKKGAMAALLLDRGALVQDLPQIVRDLLIHILSGGNWPPYGNDENGDQVKQKNAGEATDSNSVIPALPIPGDWEDADPSEDFVNELTRVLALSPIQQENIEDHLVSRCLRLIPSGELRLNQSCLAVKQAQASLVLELTWLGTGALTQPILLFSGMPLDDILIGLAEKNLSPQFQSMETKMAWAALALFINPDIARTPLLPDLDLPLANGAEPPRFRLPEETWREWRFGSGPEGPYVQLPWIEERELIWGKVLVPQDGLGIRILPDRRVLASDVDWNVPRFAFDKKGGRLPFRILGMIGAH